MKQLAWLEIGVRADCVEHRRDATMIVRACGEVESGTALPLATSPGPRPRKLGWSSTINTVRATAPRLRRVGDGSQYGQPHQQGEHVFLAIYKIRKGLVSHAEWC